MASPAKSSRTGSTSASGTRSSRDVSGGTGSDNAGSSRRATPSPFRPGARTAVACPARQAGGRSPHAPPRSAPHRDRRVVPRDRPARIVDLYDACAEGKDARLPVLPIQYPDYSAWQRRTLSGARLDEMLSVLAYPACRRAGRRWAADGLAPGGAREFVGSRTDCALPARLMEAFFEMARREKTSPYLAWLAAFNAFLNRCSGDTDIVVGVPVTEDRDRPETLGVVGFFINMLPVRTDLSGDPSFRELLARVSPRRPPRTSSTSTCRSKGSSRICSLVGGWAKRPSSIRRAFCLTAAVESPAQAGARHEQFRSRYRRRCI